MRHNEHTMHKALPILHTFLAHLSHWLMMSYCHQGSGQLSTDTYIISFKQNSSELFRGTWPSCLENHVDPD